MVYQDIHIEAFRGLRDVKLDDCGGVNLLVGGNNSGKTSVLEALILLADPTSPSQWDAAIELRSTWPLGDFRFSSGRTSRLDGFQWLFPRDQDAGREITIHCSNTLHNGFTANMAILSGDPPEKAEFSFNQLVEGVYRSKRDEPTGPDFETENGLEINLQVEWKVGQISLLEHENKDFRMVLWEKGRASSRPGTALKPEKIIPTVFATPISHRSDGYLAARVSRLLHAKRKAFALELLQTIDSNILDLVMVMPEESDDSLTLPRGGSPATLHVEHAKIGLVPIHAMGDGLRRAIHLAILVAEVGEGGVLLIDEIEVGMHTSVLQNVFQWLGKVCRENKIQLFATTHSLEAVDAVLAAVPDPDLVLYRLRPDQVRRFDGDLLRTVRFEMGQEVR